ncbi:MAG TPA: hypothetical protein VE325_02100 [Burkholderiales bacterium]|nr:hypothetical protein [Burkholderiales bacterium]
MQVRILLASLLFAGCSYVQDPSQLEATIVAPGYFKAGSGVIEAVSVLPSANKEPNARDPHLYRLSLRMDVGGFQTVDIDSAAFMAGEAVELTNDGRVVRVSGTTLNDIVGRVPTKPQ